MRIYCGIGNDITDEMWLLLCHEYMSFDVDGLVADSIFGHTFMVEGRDFVESSKVKEPSVLICFLLGFSTKG